jgi:hypothetical protein
LFLSLTQCCQTSCQARFDESSQERCARPQRHKNGEITQKSGDLMKFLLQITGIHPDSEIKLKKSAGLLLGELYFN